MPEQAQETQRVSRKDILYGSRATLHTPQGNVRVIWSDEIKDYFWLYPKQKVAK